MGFNLIPTKARSKTQKNGSGSKRWTQGQEKKEHSTPKLPMTLSCLSTETLTTRHIKRLPPAVRTTTFGNKKPGHAASTVGRT
ncbi:hypothetical protein BDQ94DRAFT_136743 [Aspergillus welwitschiae]|uniref:Uncharacterized protein n=1 Tax=Aspergillus welwitschiae TaxID=1341132 RepID=A0A3F3QES2_9EURO|nr:hypothetical protein BDQ94DRAFT_136743 [Aspergillus welwitschiae]RDH37617.1 hypothetical protein BDQ94DRAFT_136743 [Aspergillus welwitschiae]